MQTRITTLFISAILALSGCTTETVRTNDSKMKIGITLGKFENHSLYMRGLFSDGEDHLGSQARTILMSRLEKSPYFNAFDPANIHEEPTDVAHSKKAQFKKDSTYIITGDIIEFGRDEIFKYKFLLGSKKLQVTYATVSINIINPATSEVLYATQGTVRDAVNMRFLNSAQNPAALNQAVLDSAITQAIDHVEKAIDTGKWKPDYKEGKL